MNTFSKHIATAVITNPTAVSTWCSTKGLTADKGAIICSIEELGLVGTNLVYCRYGLSIPYYQVAIGEKVLVEPTVGDTERWFYTGLVDCGSLAAPAATDQLLIKSALQVIYMATAGTLHLSAKAANQPFVKGTTAKTEHDKVKDALTELQSAINGWVPVPNDGGGALKIALAAFLAKPMPDYSNILSTKIFGE